MKAFRYLARWGVVGALMLLLLISFLPASWALACYGQPVPGIELRQVSGTVWRGQAGQLLDRHGHHWGSLHWQLSPTALLGRMDLHLQLNGAGMLASAQLRQDAEARWVIDHAQWRGTPALLAPLLGPMVGAYAGQLYLDLPHAVLWHGWPMMLDAQLGWRDATVELAAAVPQPLALGHLLLRLRGQQGVIRAELDDDGYGPLQVHGQARFSPLGWQLDADAVARTPNPALTAWLGGFGPLDPHGMVHVRRGGGLLDGLH